MAEGGSTLPEIGAWVWQPRFGQLGWPGS
jgi:hypothetical protein